MHARTDRDDSTDATGSPRQLNSNGMPGLAELVDVPMLQSMMDDFYELTDTPMALLDIAGETIVGAGWQKACTQFHRVNPETAAHCLASDTLLTADIPAGRTHVYKCMNGMWDAATPVFAGDVRVGNLFTGQFFFDDEDIDLDFFRRQAATYGFDNDRYLSAIEAVPRLSRSSVETALRFLANLANMISQMGAATIEREQAARQMQVALRQQTTLTEQLASEQQVLQAIMENTDTCLAYLNPEFDFVAANSAYASGSGFTVDELLGRNHFELFPDEENQAIFERVRDSGEPAEFRAKPFEFPDQPWRGVTYWDWSLTPVEDAAGRLRGFAFSLQDVTEGVRRTRFADSLDSINDLVHSSRDIDRILEQVTPEIADAIGCEFAAVALSDDEGQWTFTHSTGLPDALRDRSFGAGSLPAGRAALDAGEPLVIQVGESPEPGASLLAEFGVRALLLVPLSVPGHEGMLVCGYLSGPGEFDDWTVDFMRKVAYSVSLAIANSHLFHDAVHSALLSDSLARINEILLEALTVDDVLARLVGEVSEVAGADKSLVIEVSDDTYVIAHVRNVRDDLVGKPRPSTFFPGFALAASLGEPVLIEDNWNDPRTNKEFVVPYGLRAFQLLPLHTQGVLTHVLAFAYDEPQVFGDTDRDSAARMMTAMSAALTNAQTYEHEHRIADRLQKALVALPDKIAGLEFAHAYHAASDAARVGGDFYDLFELGDWNVGVTIGDVAGKGLDAAVLTSLAKHTIRAHAAERGKTPARILGLTNEIVYQSTPPEAYITLFFGILDRRDGRLVYANAGHTTTAVIRAGEVPVRLSVTGPILGAFPNVTFGEAEVFVECDETLFLYTDGLTEAGRSGNLYGEERLCDVISHGEFETASETIEHVLTDVLAFGGGQLSDDLAVLAVKRLAEAGETPQQQKLVLPG